MLNKLIAHFADTEDFPITLEKVHDWIVTHGYADNIKIVPVSKDVKILRGKFYRYTRRSGLYGEVEVHVEIAVEIDQSDCFKRYVSVKELMHVFDMKHAWTNPKDVERLIMYITGPSSPSKIPPDVEAEDMAYHAALCVLAPIKAVRKLRAKHEAGEMSHLEIAKLLRIPQKYIEWILSDDYEEMYTTLSSTAEHADWGKSDTKTEEKTRKAQ